MIKKIKEYFIFGYPILTTLGFLNVFVYYQFFHIPIQDFLDFSEIITFFLDKAIIGAIVTGIAAVLLTFFNFKRDIIFEDPPTEDETNSINNEPTKFEKVFKYVKWIIPFSLLGMCIYYLIISSIKLWDRPYYIEVFISSIVIFIVWVFSVNYDLKKYGKTRKNNHALNIFLASFVVYLLLISFLNIRSVKFNHGTFGTNVKYHENDNFIDFYSDSTKYYIGKTNNYVFIFNSNNSTTKVIPIEKIDQINLKVKSIIPYLYYKRDTTYFWDMMRFN